MQEKHIIVDEYEEIGLFLRNPIFKREFDVYRFEGNEDVTGVYEAKERKGFWGVVHSILNRKKTLDRIIRFLEENDNVAYYHLRSLRNPFYTKRVVRLALYHNDSLIVESKGFHYVDERVGGHCVLEKTKVFKKINGRMKKVIDRRTDKNRGYRMTYATNIEDFIRTGVISDR